jgi:hypothetical protein
MHTWELANRDSLTEAEVEDTHFFGFAGQRRPAQLIDFVFVSADLQAYEEADYQKATAQPRCLLPVVLNSGAVVSARVDDGAMSIDVEWARGELARFLELTELYRPPDPAGVVVISTRKSNRGKPADIIASARVVEQILDRVLPDWRTEISTKR